VQGVPAGALRDQFNAMHSGHRHEAIDINQLDGSRSYYVGSSGNASPAAPHLHFAIFKLGPEQRWWEGIPINPYGFITGSPTK